MMPIGAYCDFCQAAHFSDSCYHPGRKLLEAAEAERDEWMRRALEAEDKLETQNIYYKIGIDLGYLEELAARLDAQAQHPGFPQAQPTKEIVEDWLPFSEAANRLIERTLTLELDLDDP